MCTKICMQKHAAFVKIPEAYLVHSSLIVRSHITVSQALAATTRSVLSAADTASDVTAREILTASAPTIQLGVSQGVYGSGQGRAAIMEHQVATMQS